MDVGGASLYRLAQDVVHQLDDRRFLGEFAQRLVGARGDGLHGPLAGDEIEVLVEVVAPREVQVKPPTCRAHRERLQHQRRERILRGPAECVVALVPEQHALIHEPVGRDAGFGNALLHAVLVG